jgi:hypothetical protein
VPEEIESVIMVVGTRILGPLLRTRFGVYGRRYEGDYVDDKKKVIVDFSGMMEENMRVEEETEKRNTGSELTHLLVERLNRVNDKKGKSKILDKLVKD